MRSDWLIRQQYFALIGLNSNSYFKSTINAMKNEDIFISHRINFTLKIEVKAEN